MFHFFQFYYRPRKPGIMKIFLKHELKSDLIVYAFSMYDKFIFCEWSNLAVEKFYMTVNLPT